MRWVIKTGSAILSNAEGGLDKEAVRRVSEQLCALASQGEEVILVTSGAISAGVARLKWAERPTELRLKQTAAAVGQLALMEAYEDSFTKAGLIPAQILLTREDLLNRGRYLNIRNTLLTLLENKIIPIINENDSVSTEEIQFGDNDTLSAIVAAKVDADRLVLLSDVPGLFEKGFEKRKDRKIISEVEKVTAELENSVSKISGSKMSVGGMRAKLQAAKMATAAGIETWIGSGQASDTLKKIHEGQDGAGTRFLAKKTRLVSRHAWIAYGKTAKGVIIVDEGAQKALVEKRKSLLPTGILKVRGQFNLGDTVQIKGEDNSEIGRGLVNFSSAEVQKIKGRHSKDIKDVLGRSASGEVIHRDNLVLF